MSKSADLKRSEEAKRRRVLVESPPGLGLQSGDIEVQPPGLGDLKAKPGQPEGVGQPEGAGAKARDTRSRSPKK